MYLIAGQVHSKREFILTLTLLWATIIAQIHQAQPAVGDSKNPNFFLVNKPDHNKRTCMQNGSLKQTNRLVYWGQDSNYENCRLHG